jgi:hypothetical protein
MRRQPLRSVLSPRDEADLVLEAVRDAYAAAQLDLAKMREMNQNICETLNASHVAIAQTRETLRKANALLERKHSGGKLGSASADPRKAATPSNPLIPSI